MLDLINNVWLLLAFFIEFASVTDYYAAPLNVYHLKATILFPRRIYKIRESFIRSDHER